ncbi:MAG: glutathione S-transferase family protein [Aestuariivirga sp.]|nr:glutathione S-transferase family protein [Aestuariivirga sp.]
MYKLYNVKAWGSMGVHFLLEEMNVPYTNIWMTPEQVAAPEFRELSPLGYIPALGLDDGSTLFESAAIVSFLVTAHPDKGMAPQPGSNEYGEFLSWLHFMSANLYVAYNIGDAANFYARNAVEEAFLVEKSIEKSNQLWSILAKRLETEGPWLMGENFSALDIYAFMLFCWSRPKEIALHAEFPAIAKLAQAVRARPKLKAALEAHGVMEPRS